MAEQELSTRSEHPDPAPAVTPSAPQPTGPLAEPVTLGLPAKAQPPTDDTPTIITRTRPVGDGNAGLVRGRRLAHFELLEPIGVGGMAAVLQARDTQLDRLVALKILPPEMAREAENVSRFQQEARAAARLDHDTIARVYYCGEDQGLYFIAFEYVEGDNLRDVLARRGPLPVREALHAVLQVATGLVHAAERGVVHRDIKPSNIVITPDGRAKLVDMGLARSKDPVRDQELTQSGVTLGTFDYISPEQAMEPREADVRSDIYSLGCTFYHLLTGQAPVPEGTAAKKLYHHQHVLPLDPRLLNPDVPDDVAAVLARMMAKAPGQRYQSPEHLVQHLVQVTRRLSGAGAVDDDTLLVDTPLPPPPGSRPLLVAAVAGVLVAALALLAETGASGPPASSHMVAQAAPAANGTPPPSEPAGSPPAVPGPPERPAPAPAPAAVGEPDKPAPADTPIEAAFTSADDLADFVRKVSADRASPDRDVNITIAGNMFLNGDRRGRDPDTGLVLRGRDPDPGLVLRGRRVILRGPGGDGPLPTLTTQYFAQNPTWAGLVIEAESVEVRGLRVVADANENTPRMAGLVLRGGRDHLIEDCEFVQGNWLPSTTLSAVSVQAAGPAGSAAANPGEVTPPQVTFRRCVFVGSRRFEADGADGPRLNDAASGGQAAVAVQGPAVLRAFHCAFGPHRALFRFERDSRPCVLDLRSCTALVGPAGWAAVQLEPRATCDVRAVDCLFGRGGPAGPGGPARPAGSTVAALVRQADPALGRPAYQGQRNAYYNLDAVRVTRVEDSGNAADAAPDAFAAELEDLDGTAEKVLPAAAWPWKEADPFEVLQGGLGPRDLAAAFTLNLALPELRTAGRERPPGPATLRGVSLYPPGPFAEPGRPADVRRDKVVDPTRETGGGVYASLAAAVQDDPRPGDVILVRHNGRLDLGPIALPYKPDFAVTIKADAGCQPELVLAGDARERDPCLFRLYDGSLTLEGLGLRLHPTAAGYDCQSLVTLHGNGCRVAFRHCVLTLDGGQRAPLAAVLLADPRDAMPLPGPRDGSGPRVAFDSCFARGEGDLVWSRSSRPFHLEARGSLAALTGSLLNVDAARDDAAAGGPSGAAAGAAAGPAPARVPVQVQLNRVTAHLGGHLIHLRAGADLKGLVPVVVERAVECLFVSADGKALIHLDGPRAAEDRLREKVVWKGAGNHYGSTFPSMLDQQPRADNTMPSDAVTQGRWKEFAEDADARFVPVKFAGPVWPRVATAEVARDAFRHEGGSAAGAALDQVPAPAPAARGDVPNTKE